MGGPRLVYAHFGPLEVDQMANLMREDYPWIHKESRAREMEERAVPAEEIPPRAYITRRQSP